MAIINVIDGVSIAVNKTTAEAANFVLAAATTIYGDYFAIDENAIVYRLGPSGEYLPATNKEGPIYLSAFPNMAVLEPGTYAVTKGVTDVETYVGYDEV